LGGVGGVELGALCVVDFKIGCPNERQNQHRTAAPRRCWSRTLLERSHASSSEAERRSPPAVATCSCWASLGWGRRSKSARGSALDRFSEQVRSPVVATQRSRSFKQDTRRAGSGGRGGARTARGPQRSGRQPRSRGGVPASPAADGEGGGGGRGGGGGPREPGRRGGGGGGGPWQCVGGGSGGTPRRGGRSVESQHGGGTTASDGSERLLTVVPWRLLAARVSPSGALRDY